MASRDIKTIASDLRVTRNDIGSFLSVDDSCNLVWTNSRVTSSGGIWQYNLVEEDCYIILPSARLNIGLCVAIMRGKTSRTRNEQSGIYSSRANPKVVIFPYNNNSSGVGDPDFDYIQGGPNFYCSDGIKWDTASELYVTNDLEWDEYSSVMFKSVYSGKDSNGNDKYSWVIINGVGSWDAEELKNSVKPLTEIKKLYSQFAVVAQTSSINSLSANVETTDTEFLALDSIAPEGLKVTTIKDYDTTNLQRLVPQCAVKEGDNYIKGNSYVIGRFTDDYNKTPRPVLYTEFTKAGVNIFGPVDYWKAYGTAEEPAVNEMVANSIDDNINWLGYIYDDRVGLDVWWHDIKEKSFSKRMGLRQKGTITEPLGTKAQITKYLGAVQVIVPVTLSEIKTVNQTTSTASSIRSIYAMIQNFFEISADYTMPYTNVFKVPGTCFGADDTDIVDSDIITLTSSGTGESNTDFGFGSITEIPITSKDRENGSINLVFEFIYKTPSASGTQQQLSLDAFKKLNNRSNQYVLLNFIGISSLKPTSISPEVEFESFALSKLSSRGEVLESSTTIQKAYIDYTATVAEGTTGYVGAMVKHGSYDFLSAIEGQTTGKSFFDSTSRYHPTDNVTKTILEYDTGFDLATEANTNAMKARLVIDWANRNYQFNGSLRINNEEYVGTLNSSFDEKPATIEFYRNGVVGKKLYEAIQIQYNGMVRMPWLSSYKGSAAGIFDARVNISNYKTIVHASGSVEVLMDYRCGWERAEKEWTKKVYLDGSEYDGLIEDYSTQAEDSESPSKACIVPSHAMVLSLNPTVFSNQFSLDDENSAKRSLLPYFIYDTDRDNKELRYFSTNWANSQLTQEDPLSPSTQTPAVVANPFCELVFTPTSTGMLICNVELPIQSGLSSTGYIVVKQVSLDSTIGLLSDDYTLIKDSGTSINAESNPGYTKTKISFTDSVVANKCVRYTIIIYDAPWTAATVLSKKLSLNLPSNSAIVRYRPSEQALNLTKDGINDFKSLFDTDDYKGPDTQTGLSMNSVFNYVEGDITQKYIDRTNFNIESFSQMMFNTSADSVVTTTSNKNHGACFSFHAYVLKEGV